MTETVYIDADGSIHGLNGFILDNVEMGPRKVSRVSNIEFNHFIQLWEAIDAEGNLIGRSSSRASLVDLEKDYLNNKIEANYASNKNGFFQKDKQTSN
jgi:hypothetical protein